MPTNPDPTPTVLPGWPVEPEYDPRPCAPASLAALQRDQREAARYAQPQQQVVVHHHYAAQRRGPDVQQVLGWTAVLGVVAGVLLAVAMTALALGLAAAALAILAVILRALWNDLRGNR